MNCTPGRPVIKAYANLTAADLERTPIWISCHTVDLGQAWYDDAGEDDYRPHGGSPPEFPYEHLYVIRATASLPDGTTLAALIDLTPTTDAFRDEAASASIFAPNGRRVSLLPATMGLSERIRRADIEALGRAEDRLFPVTVVPVVRQAPTVIVDSWFTHRLGWP